MRFFIVLKYKKSSKAKKKDFYDKLVENGHFAPQMSQKAPGPHRDPPGPWKLFFELPEYENIMVEKIIFELSPVEKSWCGQTWLLVIWIFHGHHTRNSGGTLSRILQNLSKHECANALASYKQEEFIP